MIDLRGRFPQEPPDFKERVKAARKKVRAKVNYRKRRFPKSEDFDSVWSDFKDLLVEAQYGGKCAFCETRIRASSPGDVEHFRPKAGVCEPTSRGNRKDTNGEAPRRSMEKARRPGYWWLAYSWSNYLFCCTKCNNWKSNSFPARDVRSSSPLRPGGEKREVPMLLNPFERDPEPHLAWDERGQIDHCTEEGRLTIDRCGLDRETLRLERERVAKKIQEYVDDLGMGLLSEERATRYLLGMCKSEEPYAGMARSLVAKKLTLTVEQVRVLAEQLHGG